MVSSRSRRVQVSLQDLDYLEYCRQVLADLHTHLHAVHRFPHRAQGGLLRAVFAENRRVVMAQCGRSMGKTEMILYVAWRFALTHPGTETYIICPELKQAKKIYWYPRRLQHYGPRKYILDEWESKLQVTFKNGSHILLDGCENYEALRGIKPDMVIYDEFQHHSKYFDEEVMQPNLSTGNVTLVVMGTPPKRDCYYCEFRNTVLEKTQMGHRNYTYVELPSSANPILDREWLYEKEADLRAKGKINVWLREYEAKLVFDTESAIFPMFSREKMVYSDAWIRKRIEQDKRKLQFYAIFDPGTATCFAVLFIAVNPYTSDVFLLDEIYETRRAETPALTIWWRANNKKRSYQDEMSVWTNYYDEAAAWFENEVRRELPDDDFALIPTHKGRRNSIDGEEGRPGESLIMSMMQHGKLHISDRCEKFCWEVENYVKDEQGRYPTTNDHLVDCLFYFINESNYSLRVEVDEYGEERLVIKAKRRETFSEVIEQELQKSDYTRGLDEGTYDTEDVTDIWN